MSAVAPVASGAAPVFEPGKGYVAADTAQQLNEDFLTKLKEAGVGAVSLAHIGLTAIRNSASGLPNDRLAQAGDCQVGSSKPSYLTGD